MKKIIKAATFLLYAITPMSAASTHEVTEYIAHFQGGTMLILSSVKNCLYSNDSSLQNHEGRHEGRLLHRAVARVNNQVYWGCWYTSDDNGSFEFNLPGVMSAWQELPRTVFTEQKIKPQGEFK